MEHYTWDAIEMEVLSGQIGRKIISGENPLCEEGALNPRDSDYPATWPSSGLATIRDPGNFIRA